MSGNTRADPKQSWAARLLAAFLVSVFSLVAGCGGDGNGGQSGNPLPVLASVSPATAVVGGVGFTLTASGTGFVPGAVMQWNGAARTTTFVSNTQLTAAIPASDIASVGTAQVTVVNPTPGGGTSLAVAFPILNPAPIVSWLSPPMVNAGSAAFELTVHGSQFLAAATVQWNGNDRATTYVSATELRAAIAAADVATPGTAQVTVVNPGPGGGSSAPVAFAINPLEPVPTITGLNPGGATAGSPAFELSVLGYGFIQGATVQWNGFDRTTTFVSAGEVRAAILANDVANPIRVPVTVKNPGADGALSNAVVFVVTGPHVAAAPVPISIAPDGSPPNGASINGGMGMAGRVAVFASRASNLVPDDTNGAWDVFMRDTCMDYWSGGTLPGCTPSTVRLSVAPDGSQADGDSGATVNSPEGPVAVSYSGRYVAFVSSATNLVDGDTNGVDDVFVTDTCTDVWGRPIATCTRTTVRASLRDGGTQSSAPASWPALAEGGGHVVFVSADPNMVAGDVNGVADVFLRDVCLGSGTGCTPGTRRISVTSGATGANGASGSPTFTGRYVAFTSAANNLVAGDTNGVVDVFMRDTCIGAETECRPSTERISLGNGDVQADGASAEPLVGLPMEGTLGDYHGRFVVFVSSAANLVAGDTNGVADVFMRDTCRGFPACTPSTQRISLTSTGQQIVGRPSGQPGHMRWDGEVVLFATAADGVVPEDTNGVEDVYLSQVCHDTATCSATSERLSVGEGGLQGSAASIQPRGNHEAWVGPEWATFFSTAPEFWPGGAPTPFYGAIFRTTTY